MSLESFVMEGFDAEVRLLPFCALECCRHRLYAQHFAKPFCGSFAMAGIDAEVRLLPSCALECCAM